MLLVSAGFFGKRPLKRAVELELRYSNIVVRRFTIATDTIRSHSDLSAGSAKRQPGITDPIETRRQLCPTLSALTLRQTGCLLAAVSPFFRIPIRVLSLARH